MGKKIVITKENFTPYLDKVRELAEPFGYEVVYETEPLKVGQYLPDAEIILGFGRKVLDGATENLKWVCSQAAGVDWFLKSPYRPEHEVILTNCSGAFGAAVAEHAVMMLLEILRLQPDYQKLVSERIFRYDLDVRSIIDLPVTILGTGDLGCQIAKRLRGFEPACITGVNISGRNPDGLFDRIVTQDRVDEMLPETGALIMCLPGTPETKGFMDAHRLALLPREAVLVNVGRGNAIVQSDLIKALTDGTISYAALDVFEKEPLKEDDPIYECPNLLMTPHASGSIQMAHTVRRTFEIFYENLDNYLHGRPMFNVVDQERGY
jgi:phosphoglycerate dehydrogenase-like enzyme